MNILGLSQPHSGCGYHRVLLPLGFMEGIKGHVTNVITEDRMEGWDIVLYNRTSIYQKDWDKFRELMGAKVVMDIDDHWRLPPNHVLYHQYNEIAQIIENNLRGADLVTVTNETLADKVRPFNDNVLVMPNALPYGRNQFHEERHPTDRVRIFWAGSVTHEHDIRMLRGPVQRLTQYADRIKMVMAGYDEKQHIWQRMFSYFTAGGQLPYMKIHALPVSQYMDAYAYADIMLIPLEASDWHACKSNLKILEAACKRIPCIVSNVAPYNQDADAPVLWVNNQQDWFKHIKTLINEPQTREALGNTLHEWAVRNYNIADVNIRRRQAFADLIATPPLLRVLHEDGGDSELPSSHSERNTGGVSCAL